MANDAMMKLLSRMRDSTTTSVEKIKPDFMFKGTLTNIKDLPDDAVNGDLYVVNGIPYVYHHKHDWIELDEPIAHDSSLMPVMREEDRKHNGVPRLLQCTCCGGNMTNRNKCDYCGAIYE